MREVRAGRATRGRRGAAAGVLLAASLAVAGCGASGGEHTAADSMADKGAAAPTRAPGSGFQQGGQLAGDEGRNGGATGESAPGQPKAAKIAPAQIIRTATVTVETKEVPEALAKARTAVDGVGGYVGDETTDRDAEGHDRSRLVLRVPPKEYDAVLGRLSRLGKLASREVSAKDVTDQVVDIDSRIKSQRASVSRVRELMEKATTISDVVSLESELHTREANLESLEAQLASLKERTGMASITLVLRQPDAAPEKKPDDPTSFGDALSGGWHAFTAAVRWLLVIIGAVLPFAAAGALLYGLWRLIRNRLPAGLRTRRRAIGGSAPKAAEPAKTAKTAEPTNGSDGTAAPTASGASDAPEAAHPSEAPEGDRGPR
ncbi:DUF4349 domain-containing protein [Streptomyces sp. NPDC050636]|uniref:DUF4349 domain-containing protein n=1 Tax=Streptomyces sp. NPDC050636 TaxID=3154510 RepID=UPI003449B12B